MDFGAGPGIGLDKNTASLGHYSQVISLNNKYLNKGWKVMNQPTNEAWFNHWYYHLINNLNVKIHFNSVLNKINYTDNFKKEIKSIKINNNEISADEYIIAIDPYNLTKIDLPNEINTTELNVINNQIGFVISFNKKFIYENNNDCFVLVDSPNNITFYPQDSHWDKSILLGKIGNNQIKSLWSGTLIDRKSVV